MSDNNFFTLFNQQVSFDIELTSLDKKLHELQKIHHPDVAANAQKAEQQSALINKAYNTLKALDSRAIHLLELSGQIVNLNDSIADLEFLGEAMEIRIAMSDAQDDADIDTLHTLRNSLQNNINEQAKLFKVSYLENDWLNAVDTAKKLKFLLKIEKDINQYVLEVAQDCDEDDDDLYV